MRTWMPLVALALFAGTGTAQQRTTTGPVVPSYGPTFEVTPDFESPLEMEYKAAFEIAQGSGARVSTPMTSVARFLNMHARAGIPNDQVNAAIVIHGSAVMDVLGGQAYRARHDSDNPNTGLIEELLAAGVEVIVCGQSAASRGVEAEEFMDGVRVALSAMTAFLVLQERGYRVNPW